MYEVFSIDLNAMDDYVQSQTEAVDFVLNIRTGWSWSLSLEKDTAWASTLFADNIFEGIAGNIDTNRTTLHISETNLFGYITNGTDRFRISLVSDILGSMNNLYFVIYQQQLCDFNPADISDIEINLELGLEADYDLYNKFQQMGFAAPEIEISNRIIAKMMVVEEFYQQFFPNLNFIYRGPYVRTASFGGDYPNYVDHYTRTNQIRAAWKSRYSCIPVDAVMLFSGSNLEHDGDASHSDASGDHYSTAFRPVSYVDVSSSGLSSFTGHNDRKAMTAAHELGHIMAFMGHVDDNQTCQADGVPCLTNTNPTPSNRVSILCRGGGYADSMCEWKLGTCPGNMMLSKFIQFKDEYLTEIRPVPSLPCEASVSCLELSIETNNPFPFPPSNNCDDRDEMTYTITVCNPCEAQEIQVAFRQVVSREDIVIMDENLDSMMTLGSNILHKSDFFMLGQNECKEYHVTTRLKESALPNSIAQAVAHIYTPTSPAPNDVTNASASFVLSGNFLNISGGTDAAPQKISMVQAFIGDQSNWVVSACTNPNAVKSFSFTGVIEFDLDNNVAFSNVQFNLQNQYCFENATIRINENSKILIKNGTLNISNSRILGCSSLWNRIVVEPGATLIMENTFIEDGEYAIQVKPGAHVEIINCTFRDNYVAFFVTDNGGALPQNIDLVQFHGNVIETQDALKAPRAGQKASAGMLLNNATGIIVGNEMQNRNQFRNLYNGIIAKKSNLVVSNSSFHDIGVLPNRDHAIYAEAKPFGFLRSIFVKGFGKDSDPAFSNCVSGVYIRGMYAIVTDCNMEDVYFGLRSTQGNNCKINFSNNRIVSNGISAIGLYSNTPANIRVTENTIFTNHLHASSIIVAENPIAFANHAYNHIGNNTINLYKGRGGIQSYSGRYFEFYKNTINLELDDNQTAIQIEGMADGLVRCNIVNNMAATNQNNRGITAKGAFSSIFSCNYLNDTKTGLSFDGMGDQSVVRGNEFTGQAVGLQMEMNGHIGPQSHKGNRWFGSFGEVGAKHLGDQASTGLSPFIVDEDEATGQPFVYLPTVSANGDWFDDQDVAEPEEDIFYCTTTSNDACVNASPPVDVKGGLGDLENKLARGGFSSPEFTTELTWTGRRHLYSRIAENSIPLQNHTYVNSFYTNAANSVIEQLHEAGQSIKEALTLSGTDLTALEGYADDIEGYLADLRQNSEALSTDTSAAGISSLLADRADILADLATTIGMADTLSADLYDELLDNIATAGTVNNSVSATVVYEVNEKDYNSLFIASIEADTFTTSQKSTLWNIANQCPLEGGDGVYHARSLYALIDPVATYNDLILCSEPQPFQRPVQEVAKQFVAKFQVYPNPAKEILAFKLDQSLNEPLLLEIFHVSGYRVHQQLHTSADGQFFVLADNLKDGLYFCRLSLNGQDLGTRKIVILK